MRTAIPRELRFFTATQRPKMRQMIKGLIWKPLLLTVRERFEIQRAMAGRPITGEEKLVKIHPHISPDLRKRITLASDKYNESEAVIIRLALSAGITALENMKETDLIDYVSREIEFTVKAPIMG